MPLDRAATGTYNFNIITGNYYNNYAVRRCELTRILLANLILFPVLHRHDSCKLYDSRYVRNVGINVLKYREYCDMQ